MIEAAVKRCQYGPSLQFAVAKIGNNIMVAKRMVAECCKYFLDLPEDLKSKEGIKEGIVEVDEKLEKFSDNYVSLLDELEGR